MTRRARRWLTLSLALLIGAGLMWTWTRLWPGTRVLAAIASADVAERDRGWESILGHDGRPSRVEALLPRIEDVLREAPDDALAHGADMLRSVDLWSWHELPTDLILREIHVRAGPAYEDYRGPAIAQLRTCPLDADPNEIMPAFSALLESARRTVRDPLYSAPFGPGPDIDDRHSVILGALSWIGLHRPWLLEQITPAPDDGKLITQWLKEAQRWMQIAAAEPIHAGAPTWDEEFVQLAADARQDMTLRREAAWEATSLDAATVTTLLGDPVADEQGYVYRAVMLAERFLPREDASALALSWIRDLDDDRKRAGAVLAARLGVHGDLVERAYGLEDEVDLMTIKFVAMMVIRHKEHAGTRDLAFLSLRSLGEPRREVDPDILLCVFGQPDSAYLLLFLARPAWAEVKPPPAAAQRWMIRRFIPPWWDLLQRAERNASPDAPAPDLHVLYVLTHRWLAFDSNEQIFRLGRLPGESPALVGSAGADHDVRHDQE